MVKTGQRAGALKELLINAGFRESSNVVRPPRLAEIAGEVETGIRDAYGHLGGLDMHPVLRPGSWDLSFDGGLVVELDEELHFNRYRAMTLDFPWADELPWKADYVRLAGSHESHCLSAGRWGKRWTNPSCERMFGPAAPAGDFDNGGAPRWKQRALYDMVKDAAALTHPDLRLTRISVYDRIDGIEVSQLLDGSATVSLESMALFIKGRTV
jgi:hypothetical protein